MNILRLCRQSRAEKLQKAQRPLALAIARELVRDEVVSDGPYAYTVNPGSLRGTSGQGYLGSLAAAVMTARRERIEDLYLRPEEVLAAHNTTYNEEVTRLASTHHESYGNGDWHFPLNQELTLVFMRGTDPVSDPQSFRATRIG